MAQTQSLVLSIGIWLRKKTKVQYLYSNAKTKAKSPGCIYANLA